MPDLERAAVTRYGLSFSEFWDSTPRELDMLMEAEVYRQQLSLNNLRHVMATILNTIPKKGKSAVDPKRLFHLSLIDGHQNDTHRAEDGQKQAEDALKWIKENW